MAGLHIGIIGIDRRIARRLVAGTTIALLLVLSGWWSLPRAVFADNPTATPLQEPTNSTIPVTFDVTGKITSGTAGVNVPPGIPITLHVAHPDPKSGLPVEAVKRDTALSADLTFSFDKVTALPGDIAFVETVFQAITQGSPPLQVSNTQSQFDMPLTLYAVTTDPSVITLVRVQHILDFKPGILQILATYDYKNNSDRLYLSTDRTVLKLPVSVHVPLPVGSQAIAFNAQNTLRFAIGGDPNSPVVQDTKPVVPGQVDEIVFSYQVPYLGGAPIDQDYPYNTSALEVLIPDDANVGISQVHIDSNQPDDGLMSRAANTTINPQRSYSQYTLTTPLKAGARLVYFLGKAPAPQPTKAPPASSSGGFQLHPGELLAILMFAALVLIAGIVVVQRAGRPQGPQARRKRR